MRSPYPEVEVDRIDGGLEEGDPRRQWQLWVREEVLLAGLIGGAGDGSSSARQVRLSIDQAAQVPVLVGDGNLQLKLFKAQCLSTDLKVLSAGLLRALAPKDHHPVSGWA